MLRRPEPRVAAVPDLTSAVAIDPEHHLCSAWEEVLTAVADLYRRHQKSSAPKNEARARGLGMLPVIDAHCAEWLVYFRDIRWKG